ncbi:MAG: adenylyl-sulfate kinase [Thermoplasmata archaeon]|jgi:adenylylsulfate kinase
MSEENPATSGGFVAWIEGVPSSGKTTISRKVAERLRAAGRKVEVLDGDEVRKMFSPELGFSRKDREFHARRVSYVARMLARNDVAVLVAMITPYETSRQAARATVGDRFTEIWLKCPVEVCRQRDPKGLYRGSPALHGTKLTGVDDPFEEPLNPDLVLDTATESVDACAGRVIDHLNQRGFLRPVLPA